LSNESREVDLRNLRALLTAEPGWSTTFPPLAQQISHDARIWFSGVWPFRVDTRA